MLPNTTCHSPSAGRRHGGSRRLHGFTLIELMIAVVIVGVLAAIAFPSYQSSIRKSRRAEAVSALSGLQQAQERWRANNLQYASTVGQLNATSTTASGYYALSVEAPSANGYTVTATAVSGTSQAADSDCSVMRLQLAGGVVAYGGCAGCAVPEAPSTVTDPNRCWAR